MEHLRIIQHIVISAARPQLRPLLAKLLVSSRALDVTEVEAHLRCCRDTALDRMRALAGTGVCRFEQGKPPNQSSYVEQTPENRNLMIDDWGV